MKYLILFISAYLFLPFIPHVYAEKCREGYVHLDKALELNDLEIEAKLNAKDKKIFKKMKKLVGQTISFIDQSGRKLVYKVEMNKKHIYKDTYYDALAGETLQLFDNGGMLRLRKRWDKKPGKKKFKFAKVVVQSKSEGNSILGIDNSVFVRPEIKGKELKKEKSGEKKILNLIASQSPDDPAVKYASEIADSSDFTPVIQQIDKRFFMKLTYVGDDSVIAPDIYLSLDSVTNKGLVGKKRTVKRLEVEAEIINLAEDKETQIEQVQVLSDFSKYIQKAYELVPSTDSKYRSGIIDTVK